ncbi:MAG: isocitrate lyase/PEP mutase family protein [Synergistales bacterium]|nr:isocitrate lyase/PEP mutase family protein [Synergistales bacterium]
MLRESGTRAGTALRAMLRDKAYIVGAGVYDALSAKCAERAGFDVVHHSGYGTAATRLGVPDIGLTDFSEMRAQLQSITRAVSVPVFGDGDTGYGNALNAYRTVQEYIRAGAAGLFLEDQKWPKRCGHLEGKDVIPWPEMRSKLQAALDARDALDPDVLIIYRTDALAPRGMEEALRRGKAAEELGVDMVFVEALETREQMELAGNSFEVPLMLNLIEGGRTPFVTPAEARDYGFTYIVYALTGLFAATRAMERAFAAVMQGTPQETYADDLVSFGEFADLMDMAEIKEMEERYRVERPEA